MLDQLEGKLPVCPSKVARHYFWIFRLATNADSQGQAYSSVSVIQNLFSCDISDGLSGANKHKNTPWVSSFRHFNPSTIHPSTLYFLLKKKKTRNEMSYNNKQKNVMGERATAPLAIEFQFWIHFDLFESFHKEFITLHHTAGEDRGWGDSLCETAHTPLPSRLPIVAPCHSFCLPTSVGLWGKIRVWAWSVWEGCDSCCSELQYVGVCRVSSVWHTLLKINVSHSAHSRPTYRVGPSWKNLSGLMGDGQIDRLQYRI